MSEELTIKIYSSGFDLSATATRAAANHTGLKFSTIYPGGLFSTCSFFVPVKATEPNDFKAGYRVAIFTGMRIIWEGVIDVVAYNTGSKEGVLIGCTGYWGALLNRRRWNKIWCDTRITEDKWPWTITAGQQEDKFRLNRYDHIRITPVETGFAAYDDASVTYTLPTGQTVNRIEASYELNEGTQAWQIDIKDVTHGSAIVSIASSGTSTFSGTPAADCVSVGVYFFNGSALTYDYDMDVYAQLSGIKVYTEAGTPTLTEIVKDIRAQIKDLSEDETLIGTNTQVIEPAFMEHETIAEYLSRLAGYGDASLNAWAAGVHTSKESLISTYKPTLYYEQQRDLTDYEYIVSVGEIDGGAEIEIAYDQIWNYIILRYTDENGNDVTITPIDDTDLTDGRSVSTYGQRDKLLNLRTSGVTEAKLYARRYLSLFKDPKYRMRKALKVRGYVRQKGAGKIAVSEVRAGMRIMIDDYLQEVGGGGLIFMITGTEYNEDADEVTINTGTPNPMEVLTARTRAGL